MDWINNNFITIHGMYFAFLYDFKKEILTRRKKCTKPSGDKGTVLV